MSDSNFGFNGIDGNSVASKVKGLVKDAIAKRNQMAQEGLDTYEYLTATPEAAKAYAGVMEKAGWEVDQTAIAGGMGSISYAMVQMNLATGEKRRKFFYNHKDGVLVVTNGMPNSPMELTVTNPANGENVTICKKGKALTPAMFGCIPASAVIAAKEEAKAAKRKARDIRDANTLADLTS